VSETINLEVPATLAALSTVRMVLGGLGARLDFSLDELEDLYLATEELLRAAIVAENLDRVAIELSLDGDCLLISTDAFASVALRRDIERSPAGDCLDLCTLLSTTVDRVRVDVTVPGQYRVVLEKRHTGRTGP
jgi:anti-sigma regulatory factor (Ser/Thr protein kinase)